MLLEPPEKPVLAMEREARFNLKSFLSKCRNHGGQTKNLCKACARASHHVQTPPHTPSCLTTPHLSPAHPTISHHFPPSPTLTPVPYTLLTLPHIYPLLFHLTP